VRIRESAEPSRADFLATGDGGRRRRVAKNLTESRFSSNAGGEVDRRTEIVALCWNDRAGGHATAGLTEQRMIFDGGDELAHGVRDARRVSVYEHRLVADELHEPSSTRYCGC